MTDFRANFRAFEVARIRYLILVALADQPNGSWTLSMLGRFLATKGYPKTPDYVRNQADWLAGEVLAVRLIPADEETIVVLRQAGRLHVEGVRLLPGVGQPDDEA